MSQSDASLVTLSSPPRLVDIQSSPTLEARTARRAAGPLDPLFFSSSPTPPPPPKRRPVKRAPTEHQRWREANRVRRRRADTMRDLIVHMDTGLAEELWSDIYVQIRARLQDDEATLRLVPRTAPMGRLVFERKVRSTYDLSSSCGSHWRMSKLCVSQRSYLSLRRGIFWIAPTMKC